MPQSQAIYDFAVDLFKQVEKQIYYNRCQIT